MRSLILVDIQNDFLPGGALAVPKGDEVVPVANRLIAKKGKGIDLIVATQDFHPQDHGSFASNNPGAQVGTMGKLAGLDQVMWPNHCVQGTRGAEFAKSLIIEKVDRVFQKGMDKQIDSYSGFYDNGKLKSTGLSEFLRAKNVTELVILGLATDYCVKFTVIDAISEGFRVIFIQDGSRAVNLGPADGDKAVAEMKKAGAQIMTSEELFQKWAT